MSSSEIIYGVNPVIEMLRAGRRNCSEIFIAEGRKFADAESVRDLALKRGTKIKTIPKEEISLISGTDKNQGMAARCGEYPYVEISEIIDTALRGGKKGFVLVLDGVTDPQNLGSLVRTAHLMGVHGVIIPRDRAALVTPAVVKASAGATEHQKIAQVTNISGTMKALKENGFWIAGADGDGPNPIYLHDFKGHNYAIVMGAEGTGLRRLVKETCDYLLSIPMAGVVGSYNVAVAGALFMGEVHRARWFLEHPKIPQKNT